MEDRQISSIKSYQSWNYSVKYSNRIALHELFELKSIAAVPRCRTRYLIAHFLRDVVLQSSRAIVCETHTFRIRDRDSRESCGTACPAVTLLRTEFTCSLELRKKHYGHVNLLNWLNKPREWRGDPRISDRIRRKVVCSVPYMLTINSSCMENVKSLALVNGSKKCTYFVLI